MLAAQRLCPRKFLVSKVLSFSSRFKPHRAEAQSLVKTPLSFHTAALRFNPRPQFAANFFPIQLSAGVPPPPEVLDLFRYVCESIFLPGCLSASRQLPFFFALLRSFFMADPTPFATLPFARFFFFCVFCLSYRRVRPKHSLLGFFGRGFRRFAVAVPLPCVFYIASFRQLPPLLQTSICVSALSGGLLRSRVCHGQGTS